MIFKRIIPFLMILDIGLVVGTGGAYENDAITTKQFIVRIIIYFTVLFFLEFLKNKKAFCSCNYKKAHRK